MRGNNFLKHFVIIGSGTFLNLVLGLITSPIVTRLVTPTVYGQLSIFSMYSNIATMIGCLGLDQGLVRYYYENDTQKYKKSLLFKCIKIPIIISTLFSILIIFLSFSNIIKFEFSKFIMGMLCIYVIIQILYRFSVLIVRLEYKSKLFSFLSVLRKASYVIIVVPLIILFKENSLNILIISTIISAFICLVISIAAQSKIWNFCDNEDSKCTVSKKELLKYSYPYIISMGITTLFQAVDKICLKHLGSYSDVGIYSSSMSLIRVLLIIQTTFNTLWAPMAIEHYTKNNEDRVFYQKANQIITVFMFFVGFSLILVKDIFVVLLGEKYRDAAYIFPFLIFNPIMLTISETTVSGLNFMKKNKVHIVIALGACVTNIIGNLILIPSIGCKGAAISTGFSYIVFFSLRTILANKYFYVDFKLKKFYFITAIAVIYALYNTFVRINIISVISYILCIIILIILYLDTVKWGISYMLGILKKYLKNKKVKS